MDSDSCGPMRAERTVLRTARIRFVLSSTRKRQMLNTLQNTPLCVYAIFLLLCYFGTRALYPTRESKTSLLITPPILLGWSLYSLGLTINPLLSISCWMAAVMFGSIVALVIFSREGVELDNTGTGLILP